MQSHLPITVGNRGEDERALRSKRDDLCMLGDESRVLDKDVEAENKKPLTLQEFLKKAVGQN